MYDIETGFLYWKERPKNHFKNLNAWSVFRSKFSGKKAGSIQKDGYVSVELSGKKIPAHRICFAIHNNGIPDDLYIDHVNGNKSDNRIENLRLATPSQNSANTLKNPCGVTLHKQTGKWQAQVKHLNQKSYIGLFENKQDAIEASQKRRKEIFKEFANKEDFL